MGKALFVYEFGAGLGHLNRLIAVAKRLAGPHRLSFALPGASGKLEHVRRELGEAVAVTEGVAWAVDASRVRPNTLGSFANPLDLYNFGDPARLRAAMERWSSLLAEEKPDVVVADFAPSARLAMQGRVPMVVAGNGYTVMPAGRLLPPAFPWRNVVSAQARALEFEMLAAMNLVRAESGGGAVDYLSDVFQGDQTFVCTFPELDPYQHHRTVPSFSPCNLPDIATGPPVPHRKGPDMLVYLPANHRCIANVLKALGQIEGRPHVYVSGADPRAVAARCRSNVVIHTRPFDFARALPRTRLLIHHAGLGTAHAGLMAGTPQLILPHHGEHQITGRGLLATGGAVCLMPDTNPDVETIRLAITSLLDDENRGRAAIRASERLAPMRAVDSAGLIADACRRSMPA